MRFGMVGIVLALGACAAPPRIETAAKMGLFTGRRVVGRSVQGRPRAAVA